MSNQNDFKPSDVLASLFQLAGQVCIGFVKLVGAVCFACYHACNHLTKTTVPTESPASHEAD